MSADEKDKITKGSLGYGAITGALDATVFKYVAGMPNAFKAVLQKAKVGKPVSEKLFKTALAQASSNALKRGAAEGLQESIGDGMTLDIMAKNLYDEERKFITGDALGRRIMEFTVGGIGSGIGDSGKLLQGKAITPEGQQRLDDETDRILEAMPNLDETAVFNALSQGEVDPEFTVFDVNGSPETVKVKGYKKEGLEVERSDGTTEILGQGELVGYNTRRPDYTLQVETETGKPDQKLSDLSSQELDKAIKEREAYATENAQSEDPLFVQGVNNALGDVFALRAEKRRRARLEREAARPAEPKQPKKKAKEVDQTGGQTFTVTYVSKESGLKTTTEVVASSLEEAETQFRNLYKDDISRDGAVEVTVKGQPEPAPTEPVPTEPVPEPTPPETAPAPEPEPTTPDRPELDVGQPLDPIPEEKFEEPELSIVEREINEANVIKFITQKFGHIFNSDLLELGGTKLRVKFVSKAPKGGRAIARYTRADAFLVADQDQVFGERDHTITFFVDRLMESGAGTRDITKTVRHELMHAIARVAAAKKNKRVSSIYEAISKSMTPAQKRLMDELYGGKGFQYNSGQHNGRGSEFFRAILEEFGYGIPSEENSRRKEILKKGTAFEKVTQLIKDIQSYIANFFKGDVLTNPEVATLFIDSVNLLAQLDPKARPVNQKLVDLVRSRISPNTDTLYDNVNDYTKDMETFVDEQLAQDDGKSTKRYYTKGYELCFKVFNTSWSSIGQHTF
jgi:hypothetical protein